MTEDKADKALRKVIISLTPSDWLGKAIPAGAPIEIDISDKLDDNKYYYLSGIKAKYETIADKRFNYVSGEVYMHFKKQVEDILDATIVNAKQRESLQKLLENAFSNSQENERCF